MMTNPELSIARGDIWVVNFNPTMGDEIQKTRPAVVMSIAGAFRYRLRIVVPITSWQEKFANDFWMIRLKPIPTNGLDKDSAASAFQVKCVSEERFMKKIGILSANELESIAAAIALCIDYNPPGT